MLRAVLFDFNGILVDDEPLHLALFQKVLEEEGIALSADDYYAEYLGYDDEDCLTAVLERSEGERPDPARLARLIARKAAYYQEEIRRDGYPFFPGAVELVRGVAAAGAALGVVSGALREEVEGALRQEGLRELVKVVVAAEDVDLGKPDPEGYRRGVEGLNAVPPLPARLLHPHEVLAIEDSPAGIRSARGAGLATLGVAQTYGVEELEEADRVVERVADLDPAELLAWEPGR